MAVDEHHRVLIVGGGSGGITVAARLCNLDDPPEVAILEPSDKHYYQPLWTLVGAGVYRKEASERDEAEFIPRGAAWIRDAAASIDPERGTVATVGGRTIGYDYLVVAAGLKLDWEAIPGLAESVGRRGTGVSSNYAYDTVDATWENIRTFRGGTALFTEPPTPVKCGGAPQKIMYLAEQAFRRMGIRDRCTVAFYRAKPGIFSVRKYADALYRIVEERGIETRFEYNLVELRAEAREAVFEDMKTGGRDVVSYDMIHVTPPHVPHDFLARSPLSDDAGWVEVDKHTLQHARHANVFALGDCSSLPTSKTGAAIRKQAPVLVENLRATMRGEAPPARYDGYTSCPLVTGYGQLVMAEFDYDKNPDETFPVDQGKPRYSMYFLKAYLLPQIYWHGMLRGRL